jgi:hypothetical protein
MQRETVAIETPAIRATSLMEAGSLVSSLFTVF